MDLKQIILLVLIHLELVQLAFTENIKGIQMSYKLLSIMSPASPSGMQGKVELT